jgi:hypothetical protein
LAATYVLAKTVVCSFAEFLRHTSVAYELLLPLLDTVQLDQPPSTKRKSSRLMQTTVKDKTDALNIFYTQTDIQIHVPTQTQHESSDNNTV